MNVMLRRFRDIVIGKILVTWIALNICYSQQSEADTVFVAESKKQVSAQYTAAIQHQSRLYNGSDYVIYISRDEEHPYFEVDDWAYGSVEYWNELYENIPLMYDISTDQVVTEHNRGNPIKLLPEKVQSFTLQDHVFVRLKPDSTNNIAEGFYDRLYDGTMKVYAKHSKVYRETLNSKEVIPSYDANTRYYLFKDGVFNLVKTKGSVLKLLADKKPELKNFIRKNNLHFKTNRNDAIVRIVAHYDSLKD
jgi:hypothetical protein